MNSKIIFIPGWMYSSSYFKLGSGINIWKSEVDFSVPSDCEYLIGHSMGATVALKLWSVNKNKNIILVNPFIEQGSIVNTIIAWLKFAWHEGVHTNGRLSLRYFPRNFKKLLKFSEENYWNILKSIPKEKIKILHGERDLFLCGNDVTAKMKLPGASPRGIS